MNRTYLVWVDVNGATRLTLINSTTGAGGVVTTLLAASNADVLNSEDTTLTVNGSPAPTASLYQNVSDSAALSFVDALGSIVTLQLPAPKSSIFMSDGETVDPTQIAGIIAAVVGSVITPGLGTVIAFVGGTRRKTVKESYT